MTYDVYFVPTKLGALTFNWSERKLNSEPLDYESAAFFAYECRSDAICPDRDVYMRWEVREAQHGGGK